MDIQLQVRWIAVLITLVLQVGCSSTNNINTEGESLLGGGFSDEELMPGLYKMSAKANMSLFPSLDGAMKTWTDRADELCGKGAYQNIMANQNVGKHYRSDSMVLIEPGIPLWVPMSTYNTSISGYILCNSSGMTSDEALKYLEDLPSIKAKELELSRKKELEELGGNDCSGSYASIDTENFYRRGRILMDMKEYKPAMYCLLKAEEIGKGTKVYQEICSSIGFMYDFGWGVEKDSSAAREWYNKGGL